MNTTTHNLNPALDLPALDTKEAAPNHARKAGWQKFGLGFAWMGSVGYLLTNGQELSAQYQSVPAIAPHLKTIEITGALLCAASVLAMVSVFRRAIGGRGSVALAIGAGLGFAVGCGPAEIMAQLSN